MTSRSRGKEASGGTNAHTSSRAVTLFTACSNGGSRPTASTRSLHAATTRETNSRPTRARSMPPAARANRRVMGLTGRRLARSRRHWDMARASVA